ncbi:hypothetical protein [Nitrosomonas supralitoralis]|nr:hypothetical protein [Nitrosomonas supralitoralis]
MNENLVYIITILGCVLSLLSMQHLFFGERIPAQDKRPEKIIVGKYELEISTILGVFLVSVITAILPYLLRIATPHILFPGEQSSQTVCNNLKGPYELRHGYIFVEKEDIRLRANNGHWQADDCRYLEPNKYALTGKDTTDFDIEIVIEKKFKKIATGTFEYDSKLLIENGKLLNRTFRLATEKEKKRRLVCNDKEKEKAKNTCYGIEMSKINNKINEALNIRQEEHKRLASRTCIPTSGKDSGDPILAFVCNDYTRVMNFMHTK